MKCSIYGFFSEDVERAPPPPGSKHPPPLPDATRRSTNSFLLIPSPRVIVILRYPPRQVGKALVDHKLVETVHVTGSDKTYDAIVWQGA